MMIPTKLVKIKTTFLVKLRLTLLREANSLPVLDEFYKKVKNVYPHTVEKTHLHTAMTYAINNERYLRYYIEDGRVEIR